MGSFEGADKTEINKINMMVSDKYSAEDIENGKPWNDFVAVAKCKDFKYAEKVKELITTPHKENIAR